MKCDHSATRASLNTFTSATKIIGVQCYPDGTFGLMGNCTKCDSTLEIEIETPRRSVVVTGEIDMAEMERHAAEVIK